MAVFFIQLIRSTSSFLTHSLALALSLCLVFFSLCLSLARNAEARMIDVYAHNKRYLRERVRHTDSVWESCECVHESMLNIARVHFGWAVFSRALHVKHNNSRAHTHFYHLSLAIRDNGRHDRRYTVSSTRWQNKFVQFQFDRFENSRFCSKKICGYTFRSKLFLVYRNRGSGFSRPNRIVLLINARVCAMKTRVTDLLTIRFIRSLSIWINSRKLLCFSAIVAILHMNHVRVDANIWRWYVVTLCLYAHKHTQHKTNLHCIALQFTFIFCSGVVSFGSCERRTTERTEKDRQTTTTKNLIENLIAWK